MYEPRVVDLIFATPLFVHIFVHDISPYIGSNLDLALKANAGCTLDSY